MIGRKRELAEFDKARTSGKAELIAILGRRRVGKTFLIRNAFKEEMTFEMSGVQEETKSNQLNNFSFLLRSQGLISHNIKFPSWQEAFQMLIELLDATLTKKKKVIFLDEFPWLATPRSGFMKAFSSFWNNWASKQNITVVICGSATSWMTERVINNKGGLHNRLTRLVHLDPFSLEETEAFLKSKNINYPRYQILQLYMMLGGIPMYLEHLQKGLGVAENIDLICFRENGFLRNEFSNLYAALFANHERHVDIINALASKRSGLTREEILSLVPMSNGGTFTKYLNELTSSDFVTVMGSFDKKKKGRIYRLTDAYSLFYLYFIKKELHNPSAEFSRIAETSSFKSWSGYAFENVCLQHIDKVKIALGISGIYTSVSSFFARPKDDLPGTQIDLVVERSDKNFHLVEIKFSDAEYIMTKKEKEQLRIRESIFRYHTGVKGNLFTTLITTYPAINNQHLQEQVDQHLTMDILF